MELWKEHVEATGKVVKTVLPGAVCETKCWLWQGSTQNGYPSVSIGHGRSKLKMHILAAYIRGGKLPDPGEVASHLCHNKLCVSPLHIVVESIAANNSRKGCVCCIRVKDGEIWNACCHVPMCLGPDTPAGFAPSKLKF